MDNRDNLQPELRQKANKILGPLLPSDRQALLVKCWMSHDARWFMVVAREYGLQAANRLNQMAAHEIGKVEAKRVAVMLGLTPVRSIDDYLLVQEVLMALFGPQRHEYRITKLKENACQVHVERCFAHENVVQAGIADTYDCGIFARVTGWPEALGLDCEMSPALGKCLKVEGRECIYTLTFNSGFSP